MSEPSSRQHQATRGVLLALCCSAVMNLSVTGITRGDEKTLPRPSLPACSERYPLVASPTPDGDRETAKAAIREDFASVRDWGTESNVELLDASDSGLDEAGLRVHYPEGSSSPSDARQNGVARGGLGFYTRESDLNDRGKACLRYLVRFDANFDFIKGGKLPGLYGGEAPSGGENVNGTNGFSMRFMWREEGQGELYPYVVDLEGASVGRGTWTFPRGRWVSVEQELVLNTPGQEDGLVRVWIDGRPILEKQGIVYRTTDKVSIDGIMFSSFFGGTGAGWRTPRDQIIDFANFRLYAPEHP